MKERAACTSQLLADGNVGVSLLMRPQKLVGAAAMPPALAVSARITQKEIPPKG